MKNQYRAFIIFFNRLIAQYWIIFFLSLFWAQGCGTTSYSTHPVYSRSLRGITGTPSISFVSDTQSPLWFEKLRLQADNNEKATEKIFDSIAHDSTCTALFHLGDITGAGSDNSQWKIFDQHALPLLNEKIPVYPAFGNHEYLFTEDGGKYNTLIRFPFLRPSWYARRIDSMAIVLLNSNISKLSEAEKLAQETWYRSMMDSLDRDPSILMIIAGCHHSPYTNSTIVSPSEEVQKLFLPKFMKSKKAKLFISGHSHAFEHFNIEGKDFLVIGGGGGLLHPLLQGNEQRWQDIFQHRDSRSFFHYCRLTRDKNMVNIEVHALNSEANTFETICKIELSYNIQSSNNN